ncbi:hypothetical protein N1851_012361 [Merluccius polli]|uniref:Uncharacterized protein n=1 Tax=Merluccius polli TaxID=89951 RepID=A0AA47MXD6_MERPO|nr:hypothetical protein N1851_012361 [Merluccius polli]
MDPHPEREAPDWPRPRVEAQFKSQFRIRLRQSEVTKINVESVCRYAKTMSDTVVFSGPLPNVTSDIMYSRMASFHCWLSRWCPANHQSTHYTREFLLFLRNSDAGIVVPPAALPPEIIRSAAPPAENQKWAPRTGVRKRGRRGGVRQRLKRQGHRRIPLPSIFLGNVQSLRNKVDELQAKVKFLPEYKNACLLALTETWLKEQDPLSDLELDGFGEPVRLDRDSTLSIESDDDVHFCLLPVSSLMAEKPNPGSTGSVAVCGYHLDTAAARCCGQQPYPPGQQVLFCTFEAFLLAPSRALTLL